MAVAVTQIVTFSVSKLAAKETEEADGVLANN